MASLADPASGGVLHVDHQRFSEEPECRLDLIHACMVHEVEQPVDIRLRYAEPTGEIRFFHAAREPGRVKTQLCRRQRRNGDHTNLPPLRLSRFWKWNALFDVETQRRLQSIARPLHSFGLRRALCKDRKSVV